MDSKAVHDDEERDKLIKDEIVKIARKNGAKSNSYDDLIDEGYHFTVGGEVGNDSEITIHVHKTVGSGKMKITRKTTGESV